MLIMIVIILSNYSSDRQLSNFISNTINPLLPYFVTLIGSEKFKSGIDIRPAMDKILVENSQTTKSGRAVRYEILNRSNSIH